MHIELFFQFLEPEKSGAEQATIEPRWWSASKFALCHNQTAQKWLIQSRLGKRHKDWQSVQPAWASNWVRSPPPPEEFNPNHGRAHEGSTQPHWGRFATREGWCANYHKANLGPENHKDVQVCNVVPSPQRFQRHFCTASCLSR